MTIGPAPWQTIAMTYPRKEIAPPGQPGHFHVVTRCVRRAFLCGTDKFSGRDFDHRRQWIEDRIRLLADSFAVSVFSYAVMSNHTHIVLHVDPDQASTWSDEEAARRWLAAFPGALRGAETAEQAERAVLSLISTPKRLQKLRERLGSLSWFMRALNEPIARMANKEDGCSGRFWEGRYKCQALLEEQAVLSAMAYVDLNPVRAAMADTLMESDHTSVQSRLKEREGSRQPQKNLLERPLKPVAGLDSDALLNMTEASYIELVQWTGEQARPDKRGKLQSDIPPAALWAVAKHPRQWVRQVQGTESAYYRAIGSAEALMLKAKELKQHWMKGVCGERARQLLAQQQE